MLLVESLSVQLGNSTLMKVVLILISVFIGQNLACPSGIGWISGGESCYLQGPHALDWYQSVQFCNLLGAKLAEIETANENVIIATILGYEGPWYWIGLHDVAGSWVWNSSGKTASYTNWDPTNGEPSPSGSCVVLGAEAGPYWRSVDHGCYTTHYGDVGFFPLCEAPNYFKDSIV